ncbi:uncharacterized protein TNCV_1174761 [Trichonephila clavipes]|nr:uncharacterized protein TNCV_1174761 [Trichonephila clavipes]
MSPHTITPAVGAMCRCKVKAGLRRSPRGLHTRTLLSSLLRLNLDSSLKMTWFNSAAVQFPCAWHHFKRRRRWVGVKSSKRNGYRDPKCLSARHLRMIQEDTGAPCEDSTCVWMVADKAVGWVCSQHAPRPVLLAGHKSLSRPPSSYLRITHQNTPGPSGPRRHNSLSNIWTHLSITPPVSSIPFTQHQKRRHDYFKTGFAYCRNETKIRVNGCQRNKSLIPKFAERKDQRETISENTLPQAEAGGRKRPNENETEVRHEGEEWKSAGTGVKNGRNLQGKLTDGTVVEVEAGASFYTYPSSDVRQMHMNVVKCSN